MSEWRDIGLDSTSGETCGRTGRSVIVAIGIDRYQHWQPLTNAVRDATGTVAVFERLGFEQIVAPLLDGRATGTAIQALVSDELRALSADDSLVLFYAGHGGTRIHRFGNDVVKTGYLIPVDASATPAKVATWIELEAWLRAVSLLPPRHILVVLDACHSGIALDPAIKWRDLSSWRSAPLAKLNARRSRRIITSALDDEIVLDSGPIRGHSLFTGCLIEGLVHGLPRAGGRVTTGSELGLYVQRRVRAYPKSQQTPDFGTFALDDRGEMVIPLADEMGAVNDRPGSIVDECNVAVIDSKVKSIANMLDANITSNNVETPPFGTRPWHKGWLGAAVAAIAALKWALAVAAFAAIFSIARFYSGGIFKVVVACLVMIGLCILMVLFVTLVTQRRSKGVYLDVPVYIITYLIVVLVVICAILGMSSLWVGWPIPGLRIGNSLDVPAATSKWKETGHR